MAYRCRGDSARLWWKPPCETCHRDEIWVRQHLHMWPFLVGRSRTPWPPDADPQPEQHPSPAHNRGCHPSFFYLGLWSRSVGQTNKESPGGFQPKTRTEASLKHHISFWQPRGAADALVIQDQRYNIGNVIQYENTRCCIQCSGMNRYLSNIPGCNFEELVFPLGVFIFVRIQPGFAIISRKGKLTFFFCFLILWGHLL